MSPLASVPAAAPMSLASVTPRVRQQNIAYDWLGNTTFDDGRPERLFRPLTRVDCQRNADRGAEPASERGAREYSGRERVRGVPRGDLRRCRKHDLPRDGAERARARPGHARVSSSTSGTRLASSSTRRAGTRGPRARRSAEVRLRRLRTSRAARILAGERRGNVLCRGVSPLRLEGATWSTATRAYERDASTEVAYLTIGGAACGRVFATEVSTTSSTPTFAQHVFLEFGDSLGSSRPSWTRRPVSSWTDDVLRVRRGRERLPGVELVELLGGPQVHRGRRAKCGFGLTYFGARYYSPALGRWLTPGYRWRYMRRGGI